MIAKKISYRKFIGMDTSTNKSAMMKVAGLEYLLYASNNKSAKMKVAGLEYPHSFGKKRMIGVI